jgi:hypothetical protein
MKTKRTTAMFLSCLFLLMSCGQNSSSSDAPGSQDLLFSEVSGQEAEDAATDVDLGASLKSRFVKVNFNVLRQHAAKLKSGEAAEIFAKVKVNLFNDETVDVLVNEAEKVSDNNIIFTGQIAGDLDSAVTLVMNDGVLVANVRRSGTTESYEIRYVGKDVHSINLKKDPVGEDCVEVATGEAEDEASVSGEDEAQAGSLIDILGAYTPYARTKAGSTSAIVALIQMGIADTNTALANSGLLTRVRLVGTMELKRNEYGSWSTDLGYLKGKTDGRWDEVHAKRSSLGADQVTVVAVYPYQSGTKGIGYIRSSLSTAFTIVRNTAFSAYTFSHELGHNIGLNHSDGYVNGSGRFRTIMAYGSYPRIRRYSNPNKPYNGYRTGDSDQNSVSIISSRAYILAGLLIKKI